jgi:hypothetical protein
MKKVFSILLAAALCLSLFACANQNPQSNPTNPSSVNTVDAAPNVIPSGGVVISEAPKGVENNSVVVTSKDVSDIGPVRWFSPDGIGYQFITENTLQTYLRTAQASFIYGQTDRKTGKFTKLERPAILEEPTISGIGNGTMMDGHLLYKFGNYGSEQLAVPGDVNTGIKLTCLDFDTGVETIVQESPAVNHSKFTYKYSDDEFLICYRDFENMYEPNEVIITVVEKYNIRTNKSTEILRERCEWADEKNTRGFVLESVCVNNGKLCGIGRVTENGKSAFYLYYFDADNKLEKKVSCQKLEEVLTDNVIAAFHVFGDKIYLEQKRWVRIFSTVLRKTT